MSNKNSILLRTLGVILLVVIILGAGAAAFMAGQSRGYMLGAYSSSNPSAEIEPGEAQSYPYWYPRMGMGHHYYGYFPFMGFMGFGGIFGFLFVGLIIFFLLRWIFFPYPRHYFNGGYPRGHWHRHPSGYGPWGEEPPVEESENPTDEAKA